MLKNNQHFHFIGICGIGMSGIAKILRLQGFKVSGCDQNIDPERSQELLNLGCLIDAHQSNLCSDPSITTIVLTSDVKPDHPEIIQAQLKNIPIRRRAEILANIMQEKISIAVAGAHGKTTTSSLMAHVLLDAKVDPTIIVGGQMHELNSNAHAGTGNFLVAESDESDRSFLLLCKKYSIVTNIDREHLNTYKDFDDIKTTFVQFINTIPTDGCNFVCIDDAGVQSILGKINKPVKTYGTQENADFFIHNVKLLADFSEFQITENIHSPLQKDKKKDLGSFKVLLPGIHNVLNATAVIATCLELGLDAQAIKNGLETFQGVDRRFTFKGLTKNHGALIFDDYGHHPTEIAATLKVAQAKTQGKITMVFQPQRFSRTMHLWNEFIQTLAHAPVDQLILTEIYPASEQPIDGISSQNMVQEIQKINPNLNISFIPFGQKGASILATLEATLKHNDLLLFQGAGKVNKLISKLI